MDLLLLKTVSQKLALSVLKRVLWRSRNTTIEWLQLVFVIHRLISASLLLLFMT